MIQLIDYFRIHDQNRVVKFVFICYYCEKNDNNNLLLSLYLIIFTHCTAHTNNEMINQEIEIGSAISTEHILKDQQSILKNSEQCYGSDIVCYEQCCCYDKNEPYCGQCYATDSVLIQVLGYFVAISFVVFIVFHCKQRRQIRNIIRRNQQGQFNNMQQNNGHYQRMPNYNNVNYAQFNQQQQQQQHYQQRNYNSHERQINNVVYHVPPNAGLNVNNNQNNQSNQQFNRQFNNQQLPVNNIYSPEQPNNPYNAQFTNHPQHPTNIQHNSINENPSISEINPYEIHSVTNSESFFQDESLQGNFNRENVTIQNRR